MNYLGRLVTNVRGFYSEINSATLTGAIDVVVIRQEDGSFTSSPFHVRFGKLGVLRSREKIVDIEINGECVPLQMKLGEAGEAFFVREVDDQVPISLSTSPIPSSEELVKEWNKLKESTKGEINEVEQAEVEEEDKERPKVVRCTNNQEDIKQKDQESPQETETRAQSATGSIDDVETTVEPESKTEGEGGQEEIQDENQSDPETGEEEVATNEPSDDVPDAMKPAPQSTEDSIDADLKSESSLSSGSPPKSQSIPIPGRRMGADASSDSESAWLDSRSLERHDLGQQFYPFSDLDTPVGSPSTRSPEITRPPSPQRYLSDTEVEINQSQEDHSIDSEISWAWGKLPKGPEIGPQGDRKSNDHARKKDNSHVHKAKRKEALSKISHKARGEGMYLDDLNSVNHEVAALYLHQALGSRGHQNTSSSEDRESGIGQSLPCSPSNEELSRDTSDVYHDIAMSLCGELRNGKVPLERFLNSMVSYEDMCADPSLLLNPKLVIRINDRYYNWQIAGPMLMSYLIFQRPLQQETVKSLVTQHMPKKEKRRSYSYWFTWRAHYDDKSSDEDEEEMKKSQHRPRLHSSPSRNQQSAAEMDVQERARTVSDCTSGNESDPATGHYKKVIRLTSEQLASLNLKEGANTATFSVTTKYQGTAACTAKIYLWNHDDKIVISDIDGTITKSDVLGHILPVVGQAWAQSGVAHFFSAIQKNGYKLLYLSARAIGQAQQTRDYLKSIKQDQGTLPDGPLFLSPESLIKAFHREVIEKKPEDFKIACLRDIQNLFSNRNPFHAGFGNKINDALSYRTVGVSVSRIFTINHKGEVRHELTNTFQTSYVRLSVLVDQMFPSYKTQGHRRPGLVAPEEFSSFTYWRTPLQELSIDELDSIEKGEESSKS